MKYYNRNQLYFNGRDLVLKFLPQIPLQCVLIVSFNCKVTLLSEWVLSNISLLWMIAFLKMSDDWDPVMHSTSSNPTTVQKICALATQTFVRHCWHSPCNDPKEASYCVNFCWKVPALI